MRVACIKRNIQKLIKIKNQTYYIINGKHSRQSQIVIISLKKMMCLSSKLKDYCVSILWKYEPTNEYYWCRLNVYWKCSDLCMFRNNRDELWGKEKGDELWKSWRGKKRDEEAYWKRRKMKRQIEWEEDEDLNYEKKKNYDEKWTIRKYVSIFSK